MKEKENMTEKEKKNQTNTTVTPSQDSKEKDITEFEEGSQENFTEEDQIKNENKVPGIKPEFIVNIIADTASQFLDNEEDQLKFKQMYMTTSLPILQLVDFEDLTSGADLSEMSPTTRTIIAVGGLTVPAVAGMYMFANKEKSKQKKKGAKMKNAE